jgi:hypothetical protein
MQGMIDLGPDEELLVPAPWTVCANFVFSHPEGFQRQPKWRGPGPLPQEKHFINGERFQMEIAGK